MKHRRLIISLLLLLALIIVLFLFKNNILRSLGNFLICEDPIQKSTYTFVLSGGPWDRGNEAVKIFKTGFTDTLVCTGENIPHDFKALGLEMFESEITEKNMVRHGVPQGNIILIKKGTSTQEESDIILQFCKSRNAKQAIIISTDFHTRRVTQVFKKKFANAGIEIIVHAAPSSNYDAQNWWTDENGLIALNNEYIKQLYYLLKY